MKIRIHDTDFDGNPVECTGEFFTGATALDIIESMKMDPFNASFTPIDYMRQMLDRIGQEKFALSNIPEEAAIQFLQRLTIIGYGVYILAEDDIDLRGSSGNTSPDKKEVKK